MSSSPNWTKEELNILKEAYPRLGKCQELQDLFPNRSLQGISLKANRMGFKVISNVRQGRTNEEYLNLCEGTNFVPLEEYKGSTTPILHMCGICEHEWRARPQQILRANAKCPICSNRDRILTDAEVDKVLNSAGFIRLSRYTGALDRITLKHKSCGYEWDTVYSYVEQGSGCPICNKGFGYSYSKENMPEKAYLYLFKITTSTDIFLKIGVTVRPINIRARELKSRITTDSTIDLLHLVEGTGSDVLLKEKRILKEFSKVKSQGVFAGHTECLDISNNINEIKEIMNENL